MRRLLMLVLLVPVHVVAAEPKPDYRAGQKMLDAYFRAQVKRIASASLSDIRTKEEWEQRRPELRRQFFEMVGLWPLPLRTDLKPMVTATVDAATYRIERLHFQSRPGLYVTGNLYVPKNAKRLPAVLYVCGHANTVRDGVSFGNKVNYQHHPAWFAQNGYVCLILDTLQLGEVPGIHHGTHRFGMWWWHALGYSPAGVECWNAIRALDYLETRPEVDPTRIAVTGRSGGGATSWWLAAADDRPQCIVPVAGIGDLYAHLIEGELDPYRKGGVIPGHCDCMYMVNTYRWDFPTLAALCAPRPLLLGNSDKDSIFPVGGFRRMEPKIRRIYDLYGASEKFVVLETSGPHKDTPELRLGAFQWINHWLKNNDAPVLEKAHQPVDAVDLQVFSQLPSDAINGKIQEQFVTRQVPDLPRSGRELTDAWPKEQDRIRHVLKTQVFSGWPSAPPELHVRLAADETHDGLRVRAYDFVSEDHVELRLWVTTAAEVEKPSLVVLTPVDESGWQEWLKELGPAFAKAFPGISMPARDSARFEQTAKTLAHHHWAFATVAPRGIGPTRWAADGSRDDVMVRRRFALIGQTVDGQRVWDIRRACQALRARPEWKEAPLWLQGKKEAASLVLHTALFEPEVKRLDLWNLPSDYMQAPALLNAARLLDLPRTLAMVLPRDVRLYVRTESEAEEWRSRLGLAEQFHAGSVKIRVTGD